MPTPSAPDSLHAPARRGWTVRLALLIVAVAALWRIALSAASPCIARDGALYCHQARDLGQRGLAAIRERTYDQHPLYAAAILGVQRTLRAGGTPDAPEAWELSGRIVSFVAGVAVVVFVGLLALRLAAAGDLPVGVSGPGVALLALALAAVLPLNTWLSADVMSDQLHAALYLAAALLIFSQRPSAALACGIVAGLAFLTRPEGATVALGAAAGVLASWRSGAARLPVARVALLAAGFVLVAGPYVWLSGRLSPKLDKEPIQQFQAADRRFEPGAPPHPSATILFLPAHGAGTSVFACGLSGDGTAIRPLYLAALIRRDIDWYALIPAALYELGRAGRVVVPVLALVSIIALRRRWRSPPFLALSICGGAHFGLCVLLLERHGYLDPRHLLPAVLLLTPFAAAALAGLVARLSARRLQIAAVALVFACLAPLAWYATRIPNGADGHIRAHGSWLRSNDPLVHEKTLVAGSSGRRIAFYADARWRPWGENEPDAERRYVDLFGHIVGGAADYFAIETGPGAELAGNAELIERLRADPALAGRIKLMKRASGRDGFASHLWGFDWSQP